MALRRELEELLPALAPPVVPLAVLLGSSPLTTHLRPSQGSFLVGVVPDAGSHVLTLLTDQGYQVARGRRTWATVVVPGALPVEIDSARMRVSTIGTVIGSVLDLWNDSLRAGPPAVRSLLGMLPRDLLPPVTASSLHDLMRQLGTTQQGPFVTRFLALRLAEEVVEHVVAGAFGSPLEPTGQWHAAYGHFLSDAVDVPDLRLTRKSGPLISLCETALERLDVLQAAHDEHRLAAPLA